MASPTKKTPRVIRTAALLMSAFVLVSVQHAVAQTPTPISVCGSVSGSVILTADLSANSNCLTVTANNTTIDGNGHTITVSGANTWAVYNANHSNLVVQNVMSNSGIYIYGSSNATTIQDSTLDNVTLVGADDVTISHNTLASFTANALPGDPPYRAVFTNNTISGSSSTLVDFNGSDGTTCPPAVHFIVTDNTLTSSYLCGGGGQPSCNEPKVLFMRCAGGNTVSRNMIRSTGTAMPARFRDAFDDSTVSDNTFWASGDLSPDGAFATLNITSGNVDKHFPQNNTFTGNIIRSDQNNAFWFEATGPGNTFTDNTFYANTGIALGTLGFGATGSTFNHNTFYNAGAGSVLTFAPRSSNLNNVFTNNIVDGGGTMYGFDCQSVANCSATYYTADYNLFFNRNGAANFGTFGSTLTALKSTMSPDDANSIEGNPALTDPANHNVSLQNGSPAINAASDGTNIGSWQTAACTELWSCGAWGSCASGSQSRTCTDGHSCGTTTNRPALTQACSCTESWSCGSWSACGGGNQTRTCSDANSCGTTASQPPLTQSCTTPDTTPPAAVHDLLAQ